MQPLENMRVDVASSYKRARYWLVHISKPSTRLRRRWMLTWLITMCTYCFCFSALCEKSHLMITWIVAGKCINVTFIHVERQSIKCSLGNVPFVSASAAKTMYADESYVAVCICISDGARVRLKNVSWLTTDIFGKLRFCIKFAWRLNICRKARI